MKRATGVLIAAIATQLLMFSANAEDSDQPYIDSLKKNLPSSGDSTGYSEKLKKARPQENDSEGYTEKLRRENPLYLQGTPGGSYSEEQKSLLPPKETGGAIEAFKQGHSELTMKRSEQVENTVELRIGLSVNRNFTANDNLGTGRAFNDVYGGSYAPDLGLLFEHHLFHHEKIGTLGLFGMAEVAFYNGQGRFAVPIFNAASPASPVSPQGAAIPQNNTGVSFRFFEVPLVAGGFYRFNWFKYVRPYVMGGPTAIGFSESRSDGGPTNNGLSHGLLGTVGASILMDWVSDKGAWDIYADSGIKHTYFNVEYTHMTTFSSPVDFSVSGAYAGIVFEY